MNVAYINPFITATTNVFRTMLSCELTRVELLRKRGRQPFQEVSGVIELSGPASGIVVLGVTRDIAIRATEVLLGERMTEVNAMVRDAIGELTNIISGNAKAELSKQQMRMGLPRVLIGRNHLLPLNKAAKAIDIVFGSEWGVVVVEVSLVETAAIHPL